MNHENAMQAPWYRHRWPWLLMAGPVTVIVAGAITTWMAATGNTALVADDYYKQGLTINRTLERERKAEELGVRTEVLASPQGAGATLIEVKLTMNDASSQPARLHVLLAHPTRSELDRELLLAGEAGHYSGVVRDLAATHWKLVIEDETRVWRQQDTLVIDASHGMGERGA